MYRRPSHSYSSPISISNSNSSDSLRTKHMKETGLVFSLKNKYLDNDMTDIILRQYYNDTPYELINELHKIYPFKHEKYTVYAGYFGLNPRIHLLVPEIVKRIKDDPKGYYDPDGPYRTKEQRLLHFYHNLAQNTNKKVIPYLKIIYDDNPDSDNLNWPNLCKNPNAIGILTKEYEKVPNKLVWSALCENPKAIEILTKEYEKEPNKNKLVWSALCKNPNAIEILTREYNKNPDSTNINWDILSGNPKAIHLLTIKINKDKKLSKSPKNKINWKKLSGNPKAIKLLITNIEEIWWNSLSGNTNPKAIQLLINRNLTKVYDFNEKYHINWNILSGNPNAIELIIKRLKVEEQHESLTHWYPDGIEGQRHINWPRLLANPSIFTINQGPPQLTEQEKILEIQLLKIKREKEEEEYYTQRTRALIKKLQSKQGI